MPLSSSQITYGEACDVADMFSTTPSDRIEQCDIVGALVNALSRIHNLEQQVRKLKETKPTMPKPITKTEGRRLAEAQAIVEKFNKEKPIGSPVTYFELIDPPAKPFKTRTRTEAWVMGGHSAMVMLEGISGGVCVDHIQDYHNA